MGGPPKPDKMLVTNQSNQLRNKCILDFIQINFFQDLLVFDIIIRFEEYFEPP